MQHCHVNSCAVLNHCRLLTKRITLTFVMCITQFNYVLCTPHVWRPYKWGFMFGNGICKLFPRGGAKLHEMILLIKTEGKMFSIIYWKMLCFPSVHHHFFSKNANCWWVIWLHRIFTIAYQYNANQSEILTKF